MGNVAQDGKVFYLCICPFNMDSCPCDFITCFRLLWCELGLLCQKGWDVHMHTRWKLIMDGEAFICQNKVTCRKLLQNFWVGNNGDIWCGAWVEVRGVGQGTIWGNNCNGFDSVPGLLGTVGLGLKVKVPGNILLDFDCIYGCPRTAKFFKRFGHWAFAFHLGGHSLEKNSLDQHRM